MEWVSVKERLPEYINADKFKKVWVYNIDGSCNSTYWFMVGKFLHHTHWAEITPPKE